MIKNHEYFEHKINTPKCSFCDRESIATLTMISNGDVRIDNFCKEHLQSIRGSFSEKKINHKDLIFDDFKNLDNKDESIFELERKLVSAVKSEDYVEAVKIRDQIRKVKESKNGTSIS